MSRSSKKALIRTGEAGQMLGMERDAVIELCKNGRLVGRQPAGAGGHWRIERASVEKLLEESRPKKRAASA